MALGESAIVQAVNWIEEQLRDDPTADRLKLIDKAGQMFNLGPRDQDFLIEYLQKKTQGKEKTSDV